MVGSTSRKLAIPVAVGARRSLGGYCVALFCAKAIVQLEALSIVNIRSSVHAGVSGLYR